MEPTRREEAPMRFDELVEHYRREHPDQDLRDAVKAVGREHPHELRVYLDEGSPAPVKQSAPSGQSFSELVAKRRRQHPEEDLPTAARTVASLFPEAYRIYLSGDSGGTVGEAVERRRSERDREVIQLREELLGA
jgi:uncharacterized short protein YbdD (DUF466 family)